MVPVYYLELGEDYFLILLSEHEGILSGYCGEGDNFHLLCQTYLELTEKKEPTGWMEETAQR